MSWASKATSSAAKGPPMTNALDGPVGLPLSEPQLTVKTTRAETLACPSETLAGCDCPVTYHRCTASQS